MPVVVKKTCDQTIVEIYTCPAPAGLGGNGGEYIGVNLGTGAPVYESTDQETDPREHKFRSLIVDNVGTGAEVHRDTATTGTEITMNLRSIVGEDGIIVTQEPDEIIISVDPQALGGNKPAVGEVGSSSIGCGTSVTLTPNTQLPNLAVDDLMVMVVIAAYAAYEAATITAPAGWKPFRHSKYAANQESGYVHSVYWKFASSADLVSATHTFTNNGSGSQICGFAFAFRNAHKGTPLMGATNDFGTTHGWYSNVGGISSAQAIVDMLAYARNPVTPPQVFEPGYSPDIGLPPSQYYYKAINHPGIRDFHHFIGTRVGGIFDDENLIGGEAWTSSISAAGWVLFQAAIDPDRWGASTKLYATGGSSRHYTEYEVQLTAGVKYTFAVNNWQDQWNYTHPSECIGVGFVDPDGIERGYPFRTLNYPGSHVVLDPVGDFNATWFARQTLGNFTGVPNPAGFRNTIFFTAQKTGAYKLRISHVYATYATTNWVHSDVGINSLKHINSAQFRTGWFNPDMVWTPNGAVSNDSSIGRIHSWGWKNYPDFGAQSNRFAFAVCPAWDTLPATTMVPGLGYSPGNGGVVSYDGLEIWPAVVTGFGASGAAPNYCVYPELYNVRRAYYFEVKILATGYIGLGFYANGAGNSVARAMWIFEDNAIYWHDGTQSTPTGGSGTAINDVFGCKIDFRDSNNITIKFFRNGVEVGSKTRACSTNGWLDPHEPWIAQVLNNTSGYPYGAAKIRAAFSTGDLAYQPTDGTLPYDSLGVPVPIDYTGIGSTGGGVPLLGGTDAAPTIKSLVAGANITITDNTNSVTIAAAAGSPTTTQGDLIRRGASADERLPIGSAGNVLTVVSGQPAWAAPTGGGGSGTTFTTENGAYVYRAASVQSMLSDTATAVTFDTEVRDDADYYSAGTNNRFTVSAAGWYLISGTISYDPSTVGIRRAWISKNGGTDRYGYHSQPANSGGAADFVSATAVLYLAANDYVQLMGFQNSGGALNLILTVGNPSFAIHRIGNQTLVNSASPTPADDGALITQSAAQSIPHNAGTPLTFNTEVRDDGGYANLGTNNDRFTITKSGWYAVSATLQWGDYTPSTLCGLSIKLNASGTPLAYDVRQFNAGFLAQAVSVVHYFTAGDYVTAVAEQYSGVARATLAGSVRFSIHRLGVSSSPGNPVNDGAFVYRAANPQSVNNTTHTAVSFDTEVRDDGGYANLGTNNTRLTAPNAGWYAVGGAVEFSTDSTNRRHIYLSVNGATTGPLARLGYNNEGADTINTPRLACSAVVYLNAGDYVELYVYQDSGSTLTLQVSGEYGLPNFYIHRLGTPRIAKSPDSYPDAPNVLDDEFEAATLSSKWAWRNQGSATAVLDRGWLKLKAPAGTTQNTRNIEQTVSGTFKIRTKLAYFSANVTQYSSCGMSIWNNASGKGFIYCFFVDSGNAYRLMVCQMNSATSFGFAPYKNDIWNGIPRLFLSPGYLEIEYDGTSVYFRWSDTGLDGTWYNIHNETTANFLGAAPDRVGLFSNSENSTDVYLLCDWFRRIA